MAEDDKKEEKEDKSDGSAAKDKGEGDKTSDPKVSEHEGSQDPHSPKHEGASSVASEEVFSAAADTSEHSKSGEAEKLLQGEPEIVDEDEYDDEMVLRRLRCLTSSFLAGVRCSLHCKESV